MKDAQGFQSDGEYLDMAARVLHLRATRTAAETELKEATERFERGEKESSFSQPAREIKYRVAALKDDEEQLQRDLDARLDAHRRSDLPPLGIDVVAERSRLSEDERVVLVAIVLSCVGAPIAESVFGPLFSCFSGLQVSDLVQLLGATTPSEWIGYRRLVLPDSPLFRDGLLRFDRTPRSLDGLMDASLVVEREAFATITGTAEPSGYDNDGLECWPASGCLRRPTYSSTTTMVTGPSSSSSPSP